MLLTFFVFLASLAGSFFVYAQALEPDYISNYAIVCSDDQCPEAVGALIAIDPGSSIPNLSCSITLIGENRVLTNSHCIPKNLRFAGASCGPQIELSFPKIGEVLQEEDVACSQVEAIGMTDAEAGGPSQRDWAILKLKSKPHRKVAEISRQELAFGKTIVAYPVYYSSFVPIGQIYKVECEVAELGYLYPQTFHPSSALFFAKGCGFQSQVGNSGTGIWNEQGRYVGLINAMVHEENQDAAQAMAQGSPNIMGLKSLCLPFLGEPSRLCGLAEDDQAFQNATILYSTLVAFEKSLKAEVRPQPPSAVIEWEKATAQNAPEYFSRLYFYADVLGAQKYFKEQGIANIGEEIAQKAADILGSVPRCVKAVLGKDKIPYTIFNFRDYQTYPGDQGLYLNLFSTRELEITSLPYEVEVSVSKSGDKYVAEYSGGAGEFALTVEEQTYIDSVCKQDQANQILVPSVRCQEIYKKWGFANYLSNFSFELPICAE